MSLQAPMYLSRCWNDYLRPTQLHNRTLGEGSLRRWEGAFEVRGRAQVRNPPLSNVARNCLNRLTARTVFGQLAQDLARRTKPHLREIPGSTDESLRSEQGVSIEEAIIVSA